MTKEGGPDFVPPAECIATFDNDGTLWAEQPLYFQKFELRDGKPVLVKLPAASISIVCKQVHWFKPSTWVLNDLTS